MIADFVLGVVPWMVLGAFVLRVVQAFVGARRAGAYDASPDRPLPPACARSIARAQRRDRPDIRPALEREIDPDNPRWN